MKPTLGSIQVRGEIAPLLELGAGFDPDMTGAENIYLNGSILGKSKEFLEDNYNDIVDYADLGEFIDVPVKNYSSGMKARLGFSIATKLDPDILIVDEILGVGDQEFRKKSTKTMEELINSGKTILLVTHNLSQMQELCDRVIWLDKGVVRMDGEAEEICKAYSEYHK
jgi:ABC-type polysaccharide/polyol phosphate transport system ATPase subunit